MHVMPNPSPLRGQILLEQIFQACVTLCTRKLRSVKALPLERGHPSHQAWQPHARTLALDQFTSQSLLLVAVAPCAPKPAIVDTRHEVKDDSQHTPKRWTSYSSVCYKRRFLILCSFEQAARPYDTQYPDTN